MRKSLRKVLQAGAAALALCGAGAADAPACDGCAARHVGYRFTYGYTPRSYGYHEYFGFYDSGYTRDADGGFYSTVGPDRRYRRAMRHRRVHKAK